jgi:hypothetical protein
MLDFGSCIQNDKEPGMVRNSLKKAAVQGPFIGLAKKGKQ